MAQSELPYRCNRPETSLGVFPVVQQKKILPFFLKKKFFFLEYVAYPSDIPVTIG
jgi:hypothetical protein